MNKVVFPIVFVIGMMTLAAGILFRVMHWPGGLFEYGIGALIICVSFLFLLIEVWSSKKAGVGAKIGWSVPYLILPLFLLASMGKINIVGDYKIISLLTFLCGISYLLVGRRVFLINKNDPRAIQFDSIDV